MIITGDKMKVSKRKISQTHVLEYLSLGNSNQSGLVKSEGKNSENNSGKVIVLPVIEVSGL